MIGRLRVGGATQAPNVAAKTPSTITLFIAISPDSPRAIISDSTPPDEPTIAPVASKSKLNEAFQQRSTALGQLGFQQLLIAFGNGYQTMCRSVRNEPCPG